MNSSQLSQMVRRALSQVLDKGKFYFLFTMLSIAGVIVLLCRGLTLSMGNWWKSNLAFFPLFIALGFLLAAGVILVRLYDNRLKGELGIVQTVLRCWPLALRISALALPFLLGYLLCYLLSGLFLLMKAIPLIGTFLAVILSVAPFLLNLGLLILALAALFLCFYLCPRISLSAFFDVKQLVVDLKRHFISIIFHFMIDLIPVGITYKVLTYAAALTFAYESLEARSIEGVLQSFFMMIPFLAIFTPVIIFFFNFSVESLKAVEAHKEAPSECM